MTSSLHANSQQQTPDDLDFWLGSWNLTWQNQKGDTLNGRNHIERILGDQVVEENFDGNPGMAFKGRSWSVFNKIEGIWKQTWVDDSGNYMDFTGIKEKGRFIFQRSFLRQGETVHTRMIFHNLKENSFTWDWERSADGGETWKLLWRLNYVRAE